MSSYTPEEFGDIINRFYKYSALKPIYEFLTDPLAFFIFALAIPLLIFASLLGAVYVIWLPVIVIVVIWFALYSWAAKQKTKYQMDDNELAAYYLSRIIYFLKQREAAKETVKEDHSKEATKLTRNLLSVVKENWTIGKFKLVHDIFAAPLKEFRLGLQFRVIPSLKGDDENQFKIVKDAMSALVDHCKNLKIANIADFNQSISALPDKQPNIVGSYKNATNYIGSHRNLKGSIYLVGILSICAIFAYSSSVYFQIPIEYVYGGTIAIFVALLELTFHRR